MSKALSTLFYLTTSSVVSKNVSVMINECFPIFVDLFVVIAETAVERPRDVNCLFAARPTRCRSGFRITLFSKCTCAPVQDGMFKVKGESITE